MQDESIEEAMWVAYRALEESAAIAARLAERARKAGLTDVARRYDARVQDTLGRAHAVRDALARAKP